MEDKINQILMNQSVMMVTLAAIYAGQCEDIEVLNQLQKQQHRLAKLLTSNVQEAEK